MERRLDLRWRDLFEGAEIDPAEYGAMLGVGAATARDHLAQGHRPTLGEIGLAMAGLGVRRVARALWRADQG